MNWGVLLVPLSQDIDFHGTERFVVRRRLGAGGMGVVYEAHDRERKVDVALKALRNIDDLSLYRFKNEFRSLADLEHPNLVRLGELFCENGRWFFTMEYLDGVAFLEFVRSAHARATPPPGLADPNDETLTERRVAQLQKRDPLFDEPRLRSALAQLATGVAALHQAGKVHRDIKPSNVLVTREGRTVLLDFGLVAELSGGSQATDVSVVGTAAYMAPEQAAARPVGAEADWYSVGSVLYEALTGRPPFEGAAIDVMVEKQRVEPPPPSQISPAIPSDLDALCVALLRRAPEARPTGAKILERLGAARAEVARASQKKTPPAQATPFVGRLHELAELRRAFEDAARGQAVTLFLHGESGLGKSALVRHFADQLIAERPDTVVLSGRCYERESVPFKAFDGIIDALSHHLNHLDPVDAAMLLPDDTALLARVFPVLRRVPVVAKFPQPRQETASPQELRTRAFGALRRLLGRMADRHRLMLFIDDLQWADADSLGLLCDVWRPPDAPPLLLVAAVRRTAGAQTEAQQALALIAAGLTDARHHELEPLLREDACALAQLLAGPAAAPIDSDALAAEAGGHPLFIQELVHHVRISGSDLRARVRLDEALWTRIKDLEPAARTLVEVVALAGIPIVRKVALQAAALSLADGARVIAQLGAANLVRTTGSREADTIEPFHDRVCEAVVENLDHDRRRSHHGRLADALESAGAAALDPQVVVRHLEAAGERDRAARQAERAAGLACEALAFDRAAELYRAALRLGQHTDDDRRRLLRALADVLAYAGRGAESADAYLMVAAGAPPATRLECQRHAAEQLLVSGHVERGLDAIGAVLAEVGERLPKTPLRALLSVLWQRTQLRLRGLGWTERDESEIPSRVLIKLDIYKAVALGLGMVDNIRCADFQSRCLLLALRTGERRRIGRAIAQEAMLLASQGGRGLSRARKLVAEASAVGQRTGDTYVIAWARAASGLVSYFGGLYEQATLALDDAEQCMRAQPVVTAWETSSLRLFQLFALRQMGQWVELGRRFDQYVRDASLRGDRYADTTMTRALNSIWLARDDVEQAARELSRKAWAPPEGGYHLQHWYELRASVELALYRGDVAGALERTAQEFSALDHSLLLRVQIVRTEAWWARGRLALLAAESPAEAARAARRLEREHVAFADVWALLLRAGVAAARGATDEAVAILHRAAERADAAQMKSHAAAARRRLGQLLGGDEGAKLVADADAALTAFGIRKPVRMMEVLAPFRT